MADLLELAARCEAATGPDSALDHAIFETVYGRKYRFASLNDDGPAFSWSIDAAMSLYLRTPERVPSDPRLCAAEALRQRAEGGHA